MGNESGWQELTEESTDAVLCLVHEFHGIRADVKWDGCVNIWDAEDPTIALHACSLRDLIRAIDELRKIGIERFGHNGQWEYEKLTPSEVEG